MRGPLGEVAPNVLPALLECLVPLAPPPPTVARATHVVPCRFLDMMEQYFEQPEEKTAGDIHPELR